MVSRVKNSTLKALIMNQTMYHLSSVLHSCNNYSFGNYSMYIAYI